DRGARSPSTPSAHHPHRRTTDRREAPARDLRSAGGAAQPRRQRRPDRVAPGRGRPARGPVAMILALLLGAVAAALVTAVALVLLLPWLRRLGVIDIPVGRSLHSRPVVRGAGLALLPGVLAGSVVAEVLLGRSADATVTLSSTLYVVLAFVTVLAFAGIGLSDDFFTHGVLGRLLLQGLVAGLAAAGVLAALGVGALWLAPVAVGLVAAVNITNFMD